MKFFSAEWCNQAAQVANESADFRHGLADPAGFTLIVGFSCTDATDTASWAGFENGVIQTWRPGPVEVERGVATLRAALATWRMAADGEQYFTDLLLGHKIKLKDLRNRVTYNYGAFDELLASWAHLPTDWEV